MNLKGIIIILLLLMSGHENLSANSRWKISDNDAIVWTIGGGIPHYDHIEMSGFRISAVLRYGVNENGSFFLDRSLVWPMLRTEPNDTHASLIKHSSIDIASLIMIEGQSLYNEKVKRVKLDGRLTVVSEFCIGNRDNKTDHSTIELTRSFFPSTSCPVFCERYTLKNTSDHSLCVIIPQVRLVYKTDPKTGFNSQTYSIIISTQDEKSRILNLDKNQSFTFDVAIQAFESDELKKVDVALEEKMRLSFIQEVRNKLQFISPDSILNVAFDFAKIRASESIFATSGGLMHGPGGEAYYAAIWANDQAEYVNPFFPFLGYQAGNESAINSFRHFARYMNSEYRPLPSSIIAEGRDIWNGAGDRGDAAMIAYGATRYALANADKEEAIELWPFVEWCLEYCRKHLTASGVVSSDSDELEGRFPSGKANLCTSCLYYDALISMGYLAQELNKPYKTYFEQAKILKSNIDKYFAHAVEGYDTYRYYDGNDVLRSWIAIPLTMGIYDRKEGTIQALFSDRLWTQNGVLTQAGTSTFWDRSTLYALRGTYYAGERNRATDFFKRYSEQRLLGEHVPYPIEAWPEGDQRHLAAESALYCRIVTEGIFGIRPIGFNSFILKPQLPDTWDKMELKNIHAFASSPFDVMIRRDKNKIKVIISRDKTVAKTYRIENGESLVVLL